MHFTNKTIQFEFRFGRHCSDWTKPYVARISTVTHHLPALISRVYHQVPDGRQECETGEMIQEQSSSGMKTTVFTSSVAGKTFSDSKTIQEKVNLSGVFKVVSPIVHCAISFIFSYDTI